MQSMVEQLKHDFRNAFDQVSQVIIGQENMLKLIYTAILACGHTLLTGAPGLAKTLSVKAVSKVLGVDSSRIQFTPDLMPGDIIGVEILDFDPETKQKQFRYIQGPVFTNILLADEINRATPRTQSALLEAMQEKSVTLGGKRYILDAPFIVFATRNPIDYEGVYPLPEAQLDRFMMEINVDYPSMEQEILIATQDFSQSIDTIKPVLGKDQLRTYQALVDQVPIPESVLKKAIAWIRKTRPQDPSSPESVRDFLQWGAGPRAGYHLMHTARAHALLYGHGVVTENDIRSVFPNVLRHRIIPSAIFNRSFRDIDEFISTIIADA
ncbi:MAG: MoxR family ATPase [Desulfobacterales bacterium]|nr:MoxR family ATPase [Desulfobacterales bacterium]